MIRLTDRPDMTLDVYRGRETTQQEQQICHVKHIHLNKFQTYKSPKMTIGKTCFNPTLNLTSNNDGDKIWKKFFEVYDTDSPVREV